MAVQVVLDSDGLDIVLNLIALDFVTTIDEELFDEAVKTRCQGPYVFVFKIRDLPKRWLGIKNFGGATEPTLICDVWNKQKIEEVLEPDGDVSETEYWVRDSDLSQWQASINTKGEHIQQIQKSMNSCKWNSRCHNRTHGFAKKHRTLKRDESLLMTPRGSEKKTYSTEDFHFRVTDIPGGTTEDDLKQAIEAEFKGSLGKVTWISYIDPPKAFDETRCRVKEKRGEASIFVEKPENIPAAYATFESENKEIEVDSKAHKKGKAKVILFPLVPVSEDLDDQHDKHLRDIRRLIVPVLRENYKPSAQLQAAKEHIRLLGTYVPIAR